MSEKTVCYSDRRFTNIEDDIKELKEKAKEQDRDISTLKESNTENRVYVKQIFDKIEDLTVLIKAGSNDNNKLLVESNTSWQKVVLELIKVLIQAIGTIGAIIAGVKLL